MSIGVVAALVAEARTLGRLRKRSDGLATTRDGNLVAISGMGSHSAAVAAALLADAGATSLISWGLAGGLDPGLTAGTVCVPETVIMADCGRLHTDRHGREWVCEALAARRVVSGTMLTAAGAIPDVAGKAAAFRATGASAVDMESYAVARIAADRGLPFIAIRVIVDTASDGLPAAVLEASKDGQVRVLPLVLGLARAPSQSAALLRLAWRYRTARQMLMAVARGGTLAPLAFETNVAKHLA